MEPLLLVVLLFVVIAFILNLFIPKIKGHIGEARVDSILGGSFENEKLFKDILIKTESGTSQIDHLLILKTGVFVIETKNYTGWIYGSEKAKKWTQTFPNGEKYSFQNPLHQNYGHIQRLKEIEGLENLKYISLVLFSPEATLKRPISNVMSFAQAPSWIHSHNEIIYTEADVYKIYN